VVGTDCRTSIAPSVSMAATTTSSTSSSDFYKPIEDHVEPLPFHGYPLVVGQHMVPFRAGPVTPPRDRYEMLDHTHWEARWRSVGTLGTAVQHIHSVGEARKADPQRNHKGMPLAIHKPVPSCSRRNG
jgi:hypothetical protein